MNDNMVEPGHQHDTEKGRVIVLNRDWLAEHTPQQIEGYISALVALSQEGITDPDQLAARLKDELAAHGVELSPTSYARTAEEILVADRLQVMTDDGEVLYSDPGISTAPPAERATSVEGTEDPEDPERPPLGT